MVILAVGVGKDKSSVGKLSEQPCSVMTTRLYTHTHIYPLLVHVIEL